MKHLFLLLITSCLIISFTIQTKAETLINDVYKIGVNDVLEIKVLDHDELRTVTAVSSDGTISFPNIGTVRVKGMSISAVEEEIKRQLAAGYIKYPVVNVSLVKSESRKIYTYGEVLRRGEVPFEDNMTIVKALSVVGGITIDGQFGRLIVMRKRTNKSNEYIDLLEAELNKGNLENREIEDELLKPDDILIVERNKTFLIEGEVSQRGRFTLEKDMTVLRALLQAGGVTKEGSYGKIKVRRKKEGKSLGYEDLAESAINDGVIENKKVEDMVLKPDDILIVERNKTFLIEGEVAQHGRFVLEKDMTVLRALLQAGGVTKEGSYGKIKVRRKQEGTSGGYEDFAESSINDGVIENKVVEDVVLQPDDILIVERSKTFLIEGEVAQHGRFVLEKDMTVVRALLQAGGVLKDGIHGKIKVRRKQTGSAEGYEVIKESKVNEGAIESREVEDTLLMPDDILIVERNKLFYIYGEANRTGEYTLTNNLTVFQALTIAGGFTKWGSESRVKILRPSDNGTRFETIKVNIKNVINGDATADIYLKHGDIIVVSTGIF